MPHNSGEPVTVVPALKRYLRNSKASITIKNNSEDEQTRYVKRYMTDGQMDRWFSRVVGSLGRSYVLRHTRHTYT